MDAQRSVLVKLRSDKKAASFRGDEHMMASYKDQRLAPWNAIMLRLPVVLCAFLFASAASATKYDLSEDIVGPKFLDAFTFQTIADPTHGRVNYVNQTVALQSGIARFTKNSFVMGADSKSTLDPAGPGRDSVRIISKNTYKEVVLVIGLRHMPEGCSTWPAIRTKQAAAPNTGIVDILEGVNNQPFDQVTLHTSGGCTVPANRSETGTAISNNCDTGCSVGLYNSSSFGPEFNKGGGGWYVMQRTSTHVSVWLWHRQNLFVPLDVRSPLPKVDPSKWGEPAAFFPNDTCDMEGFLTEHNILINLTLCGDWAGNADTYASSGCPSTCIDQVNNDPASFSGAFFDFEALRVYLPQQ